MHIKYSIEAIFILLLLNLNLVRSQDTNFSSLSKDLKGLEFRPIGPALMGGRIADIAVNPEDQSTWFVAVGSGGVWKTENRGITWSPVFEEQPSYSIGCVAIDPYNTKTVWVGTGENVSGRHVGWGDGIYKSNDGGATWKSMGLKNSEHIGKILVDPRNSNVVLVAAEGPLWSSGGDRGVYKTTDGGITWSQVLKIDEHTGVTDIEFDPENPDVVYAAAYQRRRHVWALLSGGPKSGIYKSMDNGETWSQKTSGLPKGDMGKIGLAVTKANPDLVYATIEADDKEKGFYRSMDKGESWTKRNDYISGGTGPHYYQEIEVSPSNPDLVYQMDVFIRVTRDGGDSFKVLGTGREKHSDNHALWIDPNNGKHLLAGTDGGLYETFDEGTTWRHFPNLPISQFYKLSLDNAQPFYNIVGGAQDLGTLIGPSRTMNTEGVRNQDWYVPLGADGYDNAFDPNDPNTVYMEIQEGNLYRHNRETEEGMDIQPQSTDGIADRWNWDSPLLISPHDNNRLYYGSQRLWRSDDKGNSWQPISEDLTTNRVRYELDMIGRVWSVDALYDNGAMSKYATLTSIAESPKQEGLLYTGSDDGFIHVSEDGGQNWRKSGALPKVPELSFINDIEASVHSPNVVFVSADAHKFGNFTPYLFMSNDRGRTWKSIVGNLPDKTIVWVIKQDFIDPDLLFIGTEYGIYFSPNKGVNWIPLKSGLPTIPFRDIELHPKDNDLVGASFGRGFFVLDDYSPLRGIGARLSDRSNQLFPVRDAWWYVPNVPMQAKGMPTLGSTSFATDNPPFGATFSYWIKDMPKTDKTVRTEKEKELRLKNMSVPFPGWEVLEEERGQEEAKVLFLISHKDKQPVRWLQGKGTKGLQRTHWDLRRSAPNPIDLSVPDFRPPWAGEDQGPLVSPGTYSVQMYVLLNGKLQPQGAPQNFNVIPVHDQKENVDYRDIQLFQNRTAELSRQISNAGEKMREYNEQIRYMKEALLKTPLANESHFSKLNELRLKLSSLRKTLYGDPIKQSLDESTPPSIRSRVGQVAGAHWETTQEPTKTQMGNIEIAEKDFKTFEKELEAFNNSMETFEKTLEELKAPYTPNRKL
ncbi:WD40/YVTN/BNR-like repeat-containing protein [Maribacter sp. 4G9]|uniref:WD40/YVTN/BNR-like repeat-containing protein n=1 Tax=Maribacter sp. 4G9 TaxID=1889777 RepID=UPI000C15F4AF|nr:sialidase family protein [Maribacter sp. 4G9]PIB39485.1 glycosyl hydrolase [Maribacter sp. 4G9]